MKRTLILTILFLLAAPAVVFAQPGVPGVRYVSVAPTGSCSQSPPVQVLNSSGAIYTCNNGTWAVQGGGSGSGTVSVIPAAYTIFPATSSACTTYSPTGTYYCAQNGATGAFDYNGTDAAVVINSAMGNYSTVGGTLNFKRGVYNLNSLTQETYTGWTAYYCAICIPSNPQATWVQWLFEGEARPAWLWAQPFSTAVINNGVIFNVTSTALATVTSSDMVMAIFQRPDPTNFITNEDFFSNLDVRFPTNQRGNETGIAMWAASSEGYTNTSADFNLSYNALTTGSAPVAGTLGSFGLTASFQSQGLPETFYRDMVMGYDTCYDWFEHTYSQADDAQLCNYPAQIGRTSTLEPKPGAGLYHKTEISSFQDQENLNGVKFGTDFEAGSRVDMPMYDIELGTTGYWYSGRTNGAFTEATPSNSVGNIGYTLIQGGVGVISPLPPLFTSGGGAFCINNTSAGCQFPIVYNFAKVETPLSYNGNFTASDSTGMPKVISAGVVEPTTAGVNAYGIYTGTIWPVNQYSQATALTYTSGSDYLVLYTNVTSLATENAYQMNIYNGSVSVYAYVAGTGHALGTSPSITLRTGDVISFDRRGANPAVLTVSQTTSGVTTLLYSFTDSTYASSLTGGAPGFNLYAPSVITTLQISNWTGGTLQ